MKKGFTLIELLVVVLIIGILAAVAVPQYQKAVMKSRMANMQTIARKIYEARTRYELTGNSWTNFEDFDLDFGKHLSADKTVAVYDNFNCTYFGCMVQNTSKWPHFVIGLRGDPAYWYCCWAGENEKIKNLCQSYFPQGTYLPNAPQYAYANEQCIRTPL